jgi:hypothetical protein
MVNNFRMAGTYERLIFCVGVSRDSVIRADNGADRNLTKWNRGYELLDGWYPCPNN